MMPEVDIAGALQIEGWMREEDLIWLAQQAGERNSICEIGTWKGRSAKVLADHTKGNVFIVDTFLGSPEEIGHEEARSVEIDNPKSVYKQFLTNMEDHLNSGKVKTFVGNSDDAAAWLHERNYKFDMIFIDGSHEVSQVERDITNYSKLLTEGGLLCGHDCFYPPVMCLVNKLLKTFEFIPGTSIWTYTKEITQKTLDELATTHETDKGPLGHHYTKYYSQFFEPLRKNPINLLEIGIFKGGSLRMWEEYFPEGYIHGIDIIDCKKYNSDRIITHILDQSQKIDLISFGNKWSQYFNIIIDDGSHVSSDMILTFEMLFPHLKTGGYYILEDILWDYKNLNILTKIKQLIGDVNLNGKIQLNADKFKTVPQCSEEFQFTYYEKSVEWIFTSCGLCIIKKI